MRGHKLDCRVPGDELQGDALWLKGLLFVAIPSEPLQILLIVPPLSLILVLAAPFPFCSRFWTLAPRHIGSGHAQSAGRRSVRVELHL